MHDDVDCEQRIEQPHGDEDDEPVPEGAVVETQHEDDREHEENEPREEAAVKHRHRCLKVEKIYALQNLKSQSLLVKVPTEIRLERATYSKFLPSFGRVTSS